MFIFYKTMNTHTTECMCSCKAFHLKEYANGNGNGRWEFGTIGKILKAVKLLRLRCSEEGPFCRKSEIINRKPQQLNRFIQVHKLVASACVLPFLQIRPLSLTIYHLLLFSPNWWLMERFYKCSRSWTIRYQRIVESIHLFLSKQTLWRGENCCRNQVQTHRSVF